MQCEMHVGRMNLHLFMLKIFALGCAIVTISVVSLCVAH